MQQINIDELKPHPRNNEFFDDMTGEKWNEFLESIRTSGVIEPIVITTDMVIVSGHQRVRACKELGIPNIMCEIKTYKDEDSIIKDLLETNIRQRGDIGGSAKKVGRRIMELERLYGIQHGAKSFQGNQHKEVISNKSVSPQKTQEDLAKEFGISVDTLQNYKMLADMIPELEELMDTGIVTKSTALSMIKNLSEQEQESLIESLDTTKKITKREVEKYIEEIKTLKENPQIPEDYESTKRELKGWKEDYKNLRNDFQNKVGEVQDLRNELESMKNSTPEKQYSEKIKNSTLLFCRKVSTFIENVGGYIWLTDYINEIPELEREGYIRSIHRIKEWADTMETNINNKMKEIN